MAVTHWRSTSRATFGSLETATPLQNSSVLLFLFISPFLWACSRAGSKPSHSLVPQNREGPGLSRGLSLFLANHGPRRAQVKGSVWLLVCQMKYPLHQDPPPFRARLRQRLLELAHGRLPLLNLCIGSVRGGFS